MKGSVVAIGLIPLLSGTARQLNLPHDLFRHLFRCPTLRLDRLTEVRITMRLGTLNNAAGNPLRPCPFHCIPTPDEPLLHSRQARPQAEYSQIALKPTDASNYLIKVATIAERHRNDDRAAAQEPKQPHSGYDGPPPQFEVLVVVRP
jgi:hypothetical protein